MDKFSLIEMPLKGLYIIELKPICDNRGFFEKLYCADEFKSILKKPIKQINHSLTKMKGSIRGMHYQLPPMAETKIIKCIKGSIFDIAVDIRKDSPTCLKWHSEVISEDNFKMFLIPEGFAHGFQTLEDDTEIIYFTTKYYDKERERGIRYNDKLINIKWPLKLTEISEKDENHLYLDNNWNGITVI
jgi:dTDP-4-dehydrorhamnose 3,5-epimerase